MRNLYLIAFLGVIGHVVSAQTFENVIAVAQGNKVLITYDLLNPRSDEVFAVELYGSHDNYSSPIKFVTGDVGSSVRPGLSKRIEWSVEAELKKYKGDITFELRAKPIMAKLTFRSPFVDGKVRRGKNVVIQWTGGSSMQQVKLNLYQGELLVAPIAETLNSGLYSWSVPKSLKKGKNYNLRLTSGAETVNSPVFSIKSRTPFIVKVLPVLIGGAAAYYFLAPPPPTETLLPPPPEPDEF